MDPCLSGNTVWPQALGFQKWAIFDIFHEVLATQIVNETRFARNVERDFFCDFQTLWQSELCVFLVL